MEIRNEITTVRVRDCCNGEQRVSPEEIRIEPDSRRHVLVVQLQPSRPPRPQTIRVFRIVTINSKRNTERFHRPSQRRNRTNNSTFRIGLFVDFLDTALPTVFARLRFNYYHLPPPDKTSLGLSNIYIYMQSSRIRSAIIRVVVVRRRQSSNVWLRTPVGRRSYAFSWLPPSKSVAQIVSDLCSSIVVVTVYRRFYVLIYVHEADDKCARADRVPFRF